MMRPLAWFSTLMLLLIAQEAHAEIDLAWSNCLGASGATTSVTFDCDPAGGSVYELIGTFVIPPGLPNFIAMDVLLDVNDEGSAVLPLFWELEQGGCNATGIGISASKPSACSSHSTPWGPLGSQAFAVINGYAVGYTAPNRARLLATISRDASSPINLSGSPTRYFAFDLEFFMSSAGTCSGCSHPLDIVWQGAALYTNDGAPTSTLTALDPGSSYCASVNGGGTACSATPARRKTWGELKTLYR
jgi:hypothetical protein